MEATFHYNWPPAMNYVRVTLGPANIKDKGYVFRMGVIKKDDKTKIYWQGGAVWLFHEKVRGVTFDVKRGDNVVVDKKNIETQNFENRILWDTEKRWPDEASGPSTTVIPYYF